MKQSDNDKILIIGAGITLVHAMEAANELEKGGISARVIDPFTIKPLDEAAIIANAKAAGGKIITVEDHYPEGTIHVIVEGCHGTQLSFKCYGKFLGIRTRSTKVITFRV